MREQPTIRGTRVASSTSMPARYYRYNGTTPLNKDPEVARSMAHGNQSAARLHYLRGEKPCDECRLSERARWAAQARRRRAKRAAEKEAKANASSSA